MGVFVNIEALEQYPNQYGSWIISGVQCVPVNAILCVCYHKQLHWQLFHLPVVKVFAQAPVQELKLLEDGIVAYDAAMQCDVPLIVSPVLCFLCNNPRAAQICSHLGSSTRKFCRICNVSIYFFTS